MKQNFILMILLISLISYSCTKKKLYFDTTSYHYIVSYHKDNIVISEVNKGKLTYNDTLFKKNGEYFDISHNDIILSTKRTAEFSTSISFDRFTCYKKRLHELTDFRGFSDLERFHKKIFVSESWLESSAYKSERALYTAYYYDEDYKILKIVKQTNAEFNLKNIVNKK